MKNDSKRIFNQMQKFSVINFEGKHIDEILQIQAETGLSVWSKKDYVAETEKKDSIFKIAQNTAGKIIGFALVRLLVGDSNDAFDSSEILNIAVRNSFQNTGIGQLIFDEILNELNEKNIKEIWLEVRESNLKAIAFYQKNKFVKKFERKNYYTNPTENALILHRSIDL